MYTDSFIAKIFNYGDYVSLIPSAIDYAEYLNVDKMRLFSYRKWNGLTQFLFGFYRLQ